MKSFIFKLLIAAACLAQNTGVMAMQPQAVGARRENVDQFMLRVTQTFMGLLGMAVDSNPPFPDDEYIKNFIIAHLDLPEIDFNSRTCIQEQFIPKLNLFTDESRNRILNGEEPTKNQALQDALLSNDLVKAELLLKEGANINQKIAGEIPLIMCSMGGVLQGIVTIDTIKFMIKHGAILDLAQNESSIFTTVCLIPNFDLVKLLIQHGARINAQDPEKKTALISLCECNGNPQMVQLLLENGADITIRDITNKNALDYALRNNNYAIKAVLRSYMLLNAVKENQLTIAKTLLLVEINPNVQDIKGNTPLHYAVKNGNKVMILLLLSNGASISACISNKEGELPMHLAVGTAMLPFLLKAAHGVGMPGYGLPQ